MDDEMRQRCFTAINRVGYGFAIQDVLAAETCLAEGLLIRANGGYEWTEKGADFCLSFNEQHKQPN